MRQFRFRAWEYDKMHYQVRCGGIFDGITTAPTTWNEELGWLNLTGHPHTKVMQYTGLNDVTGQEIYEGDINVNGGIVIFKDGAFLLETDSDQDMLVKYHLDIIGNIYENPELLKR